MRTQDLLRFAVASLALVACTPKATEKDPVVPAVTPANPTPTVAKAEAAPTATAAPAPTTAVDGPAPAVDLSPLPPAADALAKLPPGAATYFSARVAVLANRALATGSVPQQILRDLTSSLGVETTGAMIGASGIDPRRPVLGAMVGSSEKSARAMIEAVIKDGSLTNVEKVTHAHANDITLVRLLVPLASGASPAVAAAALVKGLVRGKTLEACPGAASCQSFGADAPLGVAQSRHLAIVAYADGADLRLDVAMPLFVEATDPGAIAALVAFRAARGGFTGRCSRFDPAATLSVCVDPVAFGDMSAAQGYGKVIQAVSGSNLKAPLRQKLATYGRDEARRNVELGSPSRRLAEDGTMVMDLQSTPSSLVATWALTKASQPAVEKAFAVERCAAGPAVLGELLPALRTAFGDPGPGFTDPKKTLNAFREAGWGAFGIALGGTWPNLVDGFADLKREVPAIPTAVRVCARVDAGRLVLSVK
jgi:hypothetical protein